MITRRNFIKHSILGSAVAGLGMGTPHRLLAKAKPLPFKISLAQWSLHRHFFDGKMDPMEFPEKAKALFGIDAVEYVNSFYREKIQSPTFVHDIKQRTTDAGVQSLLIMVDGEGELGAPDKALRKEVVENHKKWIHAAAGLGCHSIRVNAAGPGNRETLADAVVDGLSMLCEYAAQFGLNVLVENHGGFSSDGHWLSSVMAKVSMPNCGTLPDFGNFCIQREAEVCTEEFDRYQGVELLMPWAKAVSAKSYDFNDSGDESLMDYERLLQIVLSHGYNGYVGVEYEGNRLGEIEGIKATTALLKRIQTATA